MIIDHTKAIQKYGSDYRLGQALMQGQICKIERGIYASQPHISPFEVLFFKYPQSVLTMNTAFYIHGLTDVIPDKIYLATARGASRISAPHIVQVFSEDRFLQEGKISQQYDGAQVQMYSLERMLVEAMRNQKTLPLDYYKEIISSYRARIDSLDVQQVERYIALFERNTFMLDIFQREVL
jgi:predicted transcriptional regulator of viral defense system